MIDLISSPVSSGKIPKYISPSERKTTVADLISSNGVAKNSKTSTPVSGVSSNSEGRTASLSGASSPSSISENNSSGSISPSSGSISRGTLKHNVFKSLDSLQVVGTSLPPSSDLVIASETPPIVYSSPNPKIPSSAPTEEAFPHKGFEDAQNTSVDSTVKMRPKKKKKKKKKSNNTHNKYNGLDPKYYAKILRGDEENVAPPKVSLNNSQTHDALGLPISGRSSNTKKVESYSSLLYMRY